MLAETVQEGVSTSRIMQSVRCDIALSVKEAQSADGRSSNIRSSSIVIDGENQRSVVLL